MAKFTVDLFSARDASRDLQRAPTSLCRHLASARIATTLNRQLVLTKNFRNFYLSTRHNGFAVIGLTSLSSYRSERLSRFVCRSQVRRRKYLLRADGRACVKCDASSRLSLSIAYDANGLWVIGDCQTREKWERDCASCNAQSLLFVVFDVARRVNVLVAALVCLRRERNTHDPRNSQRSRTKAGRANGQTVEQTGELAGRWCSREHKWHCYSPVCGTLRCSSAP